MSHKPKENAVNNQIATGFDFEPLPDGNVLIEFYGDDGKTFNKQVVTQEVIQGMLTVARLTLVAIEKGTEAVKKLMEEMNEGGEG